jgi:polyisoprenyl-phosphate glycosyltransferase
MQDSRLISIVMPAFNEAESLATTVAAVIANLEDFNTEIIIVDDGSKDNTWAVIRQLTATYPVVRGLKFSRNFGHQAALLAGLGAARGAAVISLDSDGQHPPELIPTLIEAWQNGALVVQTLRRDPKNQGFFKRSTSKTYYRLFSWLADTPISPGSADFRLLDRRAIDVILKHPRSAMFLRGFVPWTGFRTAYLSFQPKDRTAGQTKYSLTRMLNLAKQGIMRFSVKPLRLATLFGSATCVTALLYLTYVLYTRLFGKAGDYIEGWASVAGLLALLGGFQLLIMGILGEYIGMIFEAEQSRPPFIVEEEARSRPSAASAPPPRSAPPPHRPSIRRG